ncbi:hypothetical protein ACWEOE_07410 [Amycolatopsis sp. NPDC004368]
MKRIVIVSSILATGLLSAAPAFAAEATKPTPTPPSSTTSPVPPTSDHPDKPRATLLVMPRAGRGGDTVTVRAGCAVGTSKKLSSPVITFEALEPVGSPQQLDPVPVYQALGKVDKDAKPGMYAVTFVCGEIKAAQSFKVLPAKGAVTPPPKQVSKVPVGAPQTGGTDGPVGDSSSGLAVAAGAMGVLAVGGAGMAPTRRQRG